MASLMEIKVLIPDPTDAELDIIETTYAYVEGIEDIRIVGICRALRACRKEAKAKDAAIQTAHTVCKDLADRLMSLREMLAALDKKPDD